MISFLWVGIGGFFGSALRYALSVVLQPYQGFPVATLCVNAVGCFVMGYLHFKFPQAPESQKLLVAVGFLGGFTTFSTFSFETMQLFQKGEHKLAVVNITLNVTLSITAVFLPKLLIANRL